MKTGRYKIYWRRLSAMTLLLCLMCRTAAFGAPAGMAEEPDIQAQGAVVIDAASGQILYGKNEGTRYYPASITKLMTALLVIENCSLDGTVTFSRNAVTNLESGAVSLGMKEGDKLTVRQCLYALLLKSANDVANALAEHVSGSVSAFADRMNAKAAALGCTGTHFTNPHGLNNEEHYTTPYDMALIARAAFQNPVLREIDTTLSYKIPATASSEARTVTMGHKMMYRTDSRYYEGIIGGKTGYTSKAGNTLVTGAERNGVRLIAVVMKANGTHYTDTKALLDYGFAKMAAGGPSNYQTSAGPGAEQAQGTSPQAAGVSQTAPGTGGVLSGSASLVQPGSQAAGWQKNDTGWYYVKPDGNYAAGEWLNLSDGYYWIDSDGYMATGWRNFDDGSWYYFRSGGLMAVSRWVETGGKWFYVGENGAMLKDAVTPDGYRVGSNGVWVR